MEAADVAPAKEGARVLLLFPHMVTPGGALSYTLHLGEQLLEGGASVALLVLRAKSGAFTLPTGLEVISLGGPLTSSLGFWLLFPLWQRRLNHAIAAWRPDVLVPQVFPSNWWGWLYKTKHPAAKLVWVCHEPSAFIHSEAWMRALRPWWKSLLARALSPLLARLDRRLARHSDRIIANSCFTASEVQRVYGVVPDAIASPGIDFSALSCEAARKGRDLLTVARLTKFKRIDFLLEVFREVLRSCPDLTYHIVGTGEDEAYLREMATRLGLDTRVVFHGAVDGQTLADLYRRSSLFLHGSVDEPFGMAPLEAIASGTPVVAHRSGGPIEYVTEECGRLIDSFDVEDWAREVAACLELLHTDPELPCRVRECARRFDWPNTLRPAVEAIDGLISFAGLAIG